MDKARVPSLFLSFVRSLLYVTAAFCVPFVRKRGGVNERLEFFSQDQLYILLSDLPCIRPQTSVTAWAVLKTNGEYWVGWQSYGVSITRQTQGFCGYIVQGSPERGS